MAPSLPKATKGPARSVIAVLHNELPKHGYAKTLAAQPVGSGAEIVIVEADLTRGLHNFAVVGLADKAVEEARDRVSAVLYGIPAISRRNSRTSASCSRSRQRI